MQLRRPHIERAYLSIRIGKWIVARGAGWGVIVLPLLVAALALVGHRLLQ